MQLPCYVKLGAAGTNAGLSNGFVLKFPHHLCRGNNYFEHMTLIYSVRYDTIGHVNNIPTVQFFTEISRDTQQKSYMLSLTACVWEFRNNALWDTHLHALLQCLLIPQSQFPYR